MIDKRSGSAPNCSKAMYNRWMMAILTFRGNNLPPAVGLAPCFLNDGAGGFLGGVSGGLPKSDRERQSVPFEESASF